MDYKTCITCGGHGRIIRGRDGAPIRCPTCLGASSAPRPKGTYPPPKEIRERQKAQQALGKPRPRRSATVKARALIGKIWACIRLIKTPLLIWAAIATIAAILVIGNQVNQDPERTRTADLRPPSQHIENAQQAREHLLDLVNHERERARVPPVRLGHNRAAQLHAEAAIQHCYSAHWDRWGLKPYHRYTLTGGTGADAENISGHDACIKPFQGYARLGDLSDEIEDTMVGLMESRGHRHNILDPAHTVLNIGIAHNKYNINIVQHFSADYLTYQARPHIDENGILSLKATTREASLNTDTGTPLVVYYDPPPEPLTRGQLHQTYAYCMGPMAVLILDQAALPYLASIPQVKENVTTHRCKDPYQVPPEATVPASPEQIQEDWDRIKARSREPKALVEHVHIITPPTLEQTDNSLTIVADLSAALDFHGPGIYTVRVLGRPDHMSEDTFISNHSIFWKIAPPAGNPYQKRNSANPPEQEESP